MHRELARKQPATIIQTAPARTAATADTMAFRDVSREVVVRHVNKLYAEGKIGQDYRLTFHGGTWVAAVALKPRPSWLRRHGLKLAAACGVSLSLAGVLWLVVRTIAAAVAFAAPLAGMLFAGVVVLGLLGIVFRGPSIEVIQKVRIR